MNLLIVNAGSTSIRFSVFNEHLKVLKKGSVLKQSNGVILKLDGKESHSNYSFEDGYKLITDNLNIEPDFIGYRVVHGGEKFTKPVVIDNEVLAEIDSLSIYAPLHNPVSVKIIKQLIGSYPNKKHVAVFDTAFHQTMPKKAYVYGLPYEFYEKYKVRRYGFHGISYSYVSDQMRQIDHNLKKIVICHLGGGASVCAVENFRSVDTSMGFSPLEGALMATRSGDVDDSVLLFLSKKLNLSIEQILEIENKRSGLLGLSQKSSDMLEVIKLAQNNDVQSKLAVEVFCYKLQKIIGSYASVLNGIDALVFTAGIGEGSNIIRSEIRNKLEYLNIKLDDSHNTYGIKTNKLISSIDSIPVWVIPSHEDLEIAKEIMRV